MPRPRRVRASEASAAESQETPQTQPMPDAPPLSPEDAPPPARKPSRRRSAPPAAEAPAAETPVPDAPAEPAAPRRRGRRPQAAQDDAPSLPDPAVIPEAAAPAAEDPVPVESAPPRRRRPRKAQDVSATLQPLAPVAETPAAEVLIDAPADAAPKRRRGRKSAAPSAAESPVTETPVVETPVVETPARRRGRGSRANAAPAVESAPLVEEAPQVEEAPTPQRRRGRRADAVAETREIPAEAPPEADESQNEDEGEERSGRRRRGGRRRKAGAEAPREILETVEDGLIALEPELVEEEEDEDDALLPLLPPAPVFVAPPVVPPALPPPDGAHLPRVSARLDSAGAGLPRIVIHDTPHAPFFFFVNTETARDKETVARQVRDAAQAGIHLFSCVMYLPLQNASGARSFAAMNSLVSQILEADPDGWVMPRLQCVPTNFWARTHSDQMARYADDSEGDVSLASTEFWADCVDALDALISHFADPATPGGDRVIGFHLDRGEWFYEAGVGPDISESNQTAFQHWLHARYQQLYALRAAWFNGAVTFEDAAVPASPKAGPPLFVSARERDLSDFALFSSQLVADVIAGLASAVKILSDRRLLVAVSYGYTLEFAARSDSGHLALGRILDSPDIDIVAGPTSYAGRGAGSAGAFPTPLDSVRGRGKLFLVEDDTKTFLAEGETEDTYNPKIAGGADTQAVHQRHFGAALARGAGVAWMDLWGQGWLDNPDIWRELGALTGRAEQWRQIAGQTNRAPDVAVLVDEASLAFVRSDPDGLSATLVTRTRDLILKTGASVGFYLQSDVTRPDFPDCKLCLFVNALRVTTAERQAIREKLHRPGRTLAWLYAPGVFDENGVAEEEISETVGLILRPQPWNARGGSQPTAVRHPLTERLRGKGQIGQNEILNPSYAVSDEQAVVLAEYIGSGAASLAVREHKSGWKSVFFGDPQLTVELLRGLCAYAGVPSCNAQDDIVYAAPGVLLVHAPQSGQRTFTLPRRATVFDVFENRLVATDAASFRAFLRARTSRLFLWGETAAVLSATGLSLPSVEEAAPLAADAEPETADEVHAVVDNLKTSLAGLENAVREALPLLGGGEAASEEGGADEAEPQTDAAPRSRWQRRRAALRARREAERQAQAASPEAGEGALDISALLTDLPPRLNASDASSETDREPS